MDGGLNGNITAYTKSMAMALRLKEPPPGVAVLIGFIGLNMTTDRMDHIIDKLSAQVSSIGNGSYLNISCQQTSSQSYWSFVKPEPLSSDSAGAVSLMTSRLMGRRELSDIARNDLTNYLQQALVSENPEAGTMLLFGLHGGQGPAHTPTHMRGSVLPAWRTSYAHVFTLGASINATSDASSYMNEGNPFSSTWKEDFYGENYERLLPIKQKFDPSESLFVWSGVGSDLWNYDLNSGLLCRVEP
ncbi:unnamed protein product [Penicillium pancosmium]